uniref:Uncharacterized protein n=1 Tax=Anguilla anguilla TaxID=7936 RepID=A0A0E9X9C2_ANGAN
MQFNLVHLERKIEKLLHYGHLNINTIKTDCPK